MPRNSRVSTPTTEVDALRFLSERVRAQAIRPNIFGYQPHPKQVKFHSSLARTRLYIGGNRSGKTIGGICEDIWWLTGKHPYRKIPSPPVRGRIVTTDFLNGVEKVVRPELARWIPLSDLKGGSWETAYDKELRTLTLENGSFVEFMSYDQDLDKFAGTSRHFVHYDEEPPQDVYTECQARLIDTSGDSWLTMTPVEGMTWVFDEIYEPGKNGLIPSIDVIEVEMTENPYLQESEVQQFIVGLDADDITARVKGKFVQIGGLIYKSFDPDIHVVDPFIPPKDWVWGASLDHGYNNPTSWGWYGVSPDGRVVKFYEHYESGQTIDYHARKVHGINGTLGRVPDYYVGDPSIRNTDPITGTSIYEEYVKFGIPVVLANNDVAAGIIRVARYLKPGVDGKPNLVITRNCINTIREIARYRWKNYANKRVANNHNKQELALKKDDHTCDELRYFIMSRPDLTADFANRNQEPVPNPLQLPGVATDYDETLRADPVTEYSGGTTETAWEYEETLGGVW